MGIIKSTNDFNWFLEIFIIRLLWLWLPFYALYRAMRDIMDDLEAEGN